MNVDKNEFFRQATIRICGSLDIETALTQCFHYINEFFPVTGMVLLLYEPEMNVLRSLASFVAEGENPFKDIHPIPGKFRDQWVVKWATLKEIEIINQPKLYPGLRESHQQLGWSLDFSEMIMRLELEGHRVGILSVKVNGTHRYTEEHAQLLLLLHEPFAIAMTNALRHQEVLRLKEILSDDNRYLRQQLLDSSGTDVIGADFGLREVMEMVRQVASFDTPVLVLGESGVGKEVITNVIHQSSPRRDGPLVKVNCGAIPDTLLDSELFGHEKGAFTGAITQKRGRFERADTGTIFLDEIGELPPQAQLRLLRVLQHKEIERVGGTKPIPVDIRIIAATHRNLEDMVTSGQFREDLWFRLNVFPMTIPPLRQRKEDIPALVHYFLEKKSRELKIARKISLAPEAIDQLKAYDWPGNVRELQNIIERALIRDTDGCLRFDDLIVSPQYPADMFRATDAQHVLTLDGVNSRHIRQVLKLADGKINGPGGAAELLDIHPNTLRKRMQKLGISYKRKERT